MIKCSNRIKSNTAYIVEDIDEEPINKITIDKYLENDDLIKNIKDGNIFLVCKNKHILTKVQSKIITNHFRHINSQNITPNPMTEWHINWQQKFKETEKFIPKKHNSYKNRYADACIANTVFEFQHSRITEQEVNERHNDYVKCYNVNLVWILHCDNSIELIEVPVYNKIIIKFLNDQWKFSSFKYHEEIFLNIEDKIFKINPNNIKSNMIDVNEYKTVSEFIESYINDENIWNNEKIIHNRLYHNQFGAGCGKTYNSIQLINDDDRFNHKKLFIYLSKMNSAKDVIQQELIDQYDRGDLCNIINLRKNNNNNHKRYSYEYVNKKHNVASAIIMGTIDSLMFAVGNRELSKSGDYFYSVTESVKKGYVDFSKNIMYGDVNLSKNLNQEALIIIDEAQDLDYV